MALWDCIGVDIRLSAPQAKVGNISLTNLAAAIQIRNGHGIFDLGHANIWGRSVQSNIEIMPSGQEIRIGGTMSGASIDTQEALETLGFIPFVQSKTNFTATIQTRAGFWMEVFTKMQGELTLKMSSGWLLGYDLNELQTKLSNKQQFLLTINDSLSTNFEHWNIQASFSERVMKVTESLMRTADLSLSIQGAVPMAIAQGQQNELILQAQLRKNYRSETLCKDVQCLANSLAWPFTFSLSFKGQDHGNFLITKDIDTD